MRREILIRKRGLHAVFTVFVLAALLSSCKGLSIVEEQREGLLSLKFETGSLTKAVIRDFPDSNLFRLKLCRSGGEVIYEGLYGSKPESFSLLPGTYDVEIVSRVFGVPEFEAPYYADKKSVVVESDAAVTLSLLCKQINSGVRLRYTDNFKKRFAGYTPEVSDSKGSVEYPYDEMRFLYINSGTFEINVKERSSSKSLLITKREVEPNEILTLFLDAVSGAPGSKAGIMIDTVSLWLSDQFVYGRIIDGSSKENALRVEDFGDYIGKKGVWVSGYIAGTLASSSLISSPPFGSETNIAIATAIAELNKDKCAGVALPAGNIREALNLKSNAYNLGKKVYLKGNIVESYFGIRGINSITEFYLEE